MQDLSKYAFVNAKARAMISKLISPYLFERLLDSGNTQELLKELEKTPYSSLIEKFKDSRINIPRLEKEIVKSAVDDFLRIVKVFPSGSEKELAGLILEHYELEEVKVALRLWDKHESVQIDDYFLRKQIRYPLDFKKIVSSGSLEDLLALFDNTPYKKPLILAGARFKKDGLLFCLEAALDADYYRRVFLCLDRFSDADKKAAGKIIGVQVDIENLNLMLRLSKEYFSGSGRDMEWFIPGGNWINKEAVRGFYSGGSVDLGPYEKIRNMVAGDPALIERFLYDILTRQVNAALSGFPFTIGTILAYFALKRQEIKNLISTFYAKEYGWDKQKAMTIIGGSV